MTQHFDAVVMGGQTSGVVAAAILAKRGKRVALFDHGENTGYYRRKGLRLPLVPSLVPLLEGSPVIQKIHTELGLGPELRTSTTVLKPGFQAVMPDHRIDVAADREELIRELGAEFPERLDALRRFFDKLYAIDAEISTFLAASPPLPPAGFIQRFRSRQLLRTVAHLDTPFAKDELLSGIPADHPLCELLLGPLTFFGHLDPDAPSTFHAVRLVARYFSGVVGFADRLGGLPATLCRAAKQAGVEMHRGAVIKHVGLEGRRLVEAEIDGIKGTVTADFFVANTLCPFQDLLPPNKLQARYALSQQSVRPSKGLLVVNLVVRRDVVPRAMAGAVFLLNGRRRTRGGDAVDPPLFVQRFPARRGEPGPVRGTETLEDEAHEVLCIACPVTTAEVSHSPERLAVLKQQMIERVGRLVPFLRNNLIDASLPTETSTWDIEGDNTARRLDPWAMHPIYEPLARPFLGVAARTTTTVYPNLFHCGFDVVPGLGIEGEYLAGQGVADEISMRARSAGKR
jgi:phytoene dehydrogenase-like protein